MRVHARRLFCIPFLLPAALVFLGGCAICRRFGIRIRKDDLVTDDGRIEVAIFEFATAVKTPKIGYCRDCKSEVETDDEYRCPKCGWPL
jgi:hypothetical protein